MDDMTVLYDLKDRTAVLTLNRPDKLNALNKAMHEALQTALDRAEADGARVIVLRGAGRAFSAGQDLDEALAMQQGAPDLGLALERHYNPLIRRLADSPVPTLAVVHGVAAGASANIALACDLTLVAEDARLDQAFVRIALMPDAGGTWAVPRAVGRQRALGLMLTGDPITGREAADWGLVWQAVPADRLEAEAMGLAERIASGPADAIRAMRRAVRASESGTLDAQLDLERDLQSELGRSRDFGEGLRAFAEKRAPRFG